MHYTGKNLYITYGGTVISGDQRTLSWDYSVDTADTTAGADNDKSYIATIRDVTISVTILDNGTDGSAVRRALAVGGTGELIFAPEGTASGKPKYGCGVICQSLSTEYPYDGEVEFEVEFQRSGAWTYHYEDSGSTY